MKRLLDEESEIQESQYKFPYHYLPHKTKEGFSIGRFWSWGFRYYVGLEYVIEKLDNVNFETLIDIGCGDGRFLYLLADKYNEKNLTGVDVSSSALSFARAFTDNIDFIEGNIIKDDLSQQYDIATLIEVLEHIPPNELPKFLEAVSEVLKNKGKVVITVPHENKSVNDKHYQHFTQSELRGTLTEVFGKIKIEPFDRQSRLFWLITKVLGINGNNYLVTNETINNWVYSFYKKFLLEVDSESNCERLFAYCEI